MTNTQASSFTKAFRTLNILLWPVVVVSFLESNNLFLAMRFPPEVVRDLSWFEFIINNSLKVAVCSFTYGFLVDIALKRHLFQTIASFLGNLRVFWGMVVIASAIPYLVHFFIFMLSGIGLGIEVPLHTVQMICQPVIMMVYVRLILMKKIPAFSPRRSSLSGWLTLFAAVAVFLLTYILYSFVPDTSTAAKSLAIFIFKYTGFWMFLVLTHKALEENGIGPCEAASKKNEIILISLPLGGIVQGIASIVAAPYPFVFAIIRALTPSTYVFREYNRIAWRDDFYQNVSLVAITCLTNNAIPAYKIAKEFRKRGCKVVMGGAHVTAFPDEALEFCDAVVIGPVESVWKGLLKDHESGGLKRKYALPPSEKDYKATADYLISQPPSMAYQCLETTRGCKFDCYFCGGGHLRIGYHQHPVPTTIAMVRKAAQHSRELIFLDDNIYSNPAYARELFQQMRLLKVRWKGSSSLDIAKDPEMLRLCKESGCLELTIGYETFPGSKEAGKGKFAMAHDYIKLTDALKKAGIRVKGNFIYGFESDDLFTFWKLWSFMNRLSLVSTQISLYTPTPNSRFFQDIDASDRFINLNWNRLDAMTLMFDHPKLNNPLFRDGFMFILLFSLATTCWLGRGLLAFVIYYISMGWL